MAKDKTDVIEQKKHELESELEQIQHELDDSIHKVRSDVTDSLNPKHIIKRYPWPALGGSFLLGLLVSGIGNGRKKSSKTTKTRSSSEEAFSPTLFKELKKVLVRSAASMAGSYLEDIVQSRVSNKSESRRNSGKVIIKE